MLVTVRVQYNTSSIVIMTGISAQEEADTLMILHCKDVVESGAQAIVQYVHIYFQNRYILLLVIRRVPELAPMQHVSWEQEQALNA